VRRSHAALLDLLYFPSHYSNFTRCAASSFLVLINVQFQIHVTYLPVFMLRLNKVEMCFNEIHICMCLWENKETKNLPISSLSLELM
jgi:hypothetical protein